MVEQKFKKILIIGTTPIALHLIEKLSLSNPDTQIDCVTTFEIEKINLPNVKTIYFDLYYNSHSILVTKHNVKYIDKISKDFSFGFR